VMKFALRAAVKLAILIAALAALAGIGCGVTKNKLCGSGVAGPERKVYIISNGFHTGIALPLKEVSSEELPEVVDFPGAAYLEFGWGARDFYMSAAPSLLTGLKALFFSSSGVVRASSMNTSSLEVWPSSRIVMLPLTPEAERRLLRYVARSIYRSDHGKTDALKPDWISRGRFYPAHGRFYFAHTCNTWVARGLQEAGCGINFPLPVTAGRLLSLVRKL
jgi:uncharacterized protein (TIGR02117 family)